MTDPEELPIFRPRMGRGRRAPSRDGSGSFRGAVLARIGRGRVARGRAAAGAGRRAYSKAHRPDARRVVVKAHVQRLTARGAQAAALHLRYIERDGVEKDGSKGVLYDADGPVRRETFEQRRVSASPTNFGSLSRRKTPRNSTWVRAALDGAGRAGTWGAASNGRRSIITIPNTLTRNWSSEGWTGKAVSCGATAATSRTACVGAPRRSPPRSSGRGTSTRFGGRALAR